MSDTSTGDPGKPMEQPSEDLSEVMRQLSVNTDDSYRTSKPPKNFSDMPVDVVALIIERSSYKQQLKLRKVSKSLRALVDKFKPACKSIQIDCFKERVNIRINDDTAIYKSGLDDDDGSFWAGYVPETTILREDFKKVAFDDLACTLKNPKLQLEEFSVSFGCSPEIDEYYNEIRNVLELLDDQLSVKIVDLRVFSPSCLLSILPYLKPGVLEKIALSFDYRAVDWRSDSSGMDQIALLEQWKQAKELYLLYPSHRFQMEYATHFKRFLLSETTMNHDEFTRIKNFLFKLDHLEQFTLFIEEFLFIPDSYYQVLGQPVFSNTTEEIFHYSIPDSDCFLELKRVTRSAKLEIEKKKREIHS